MSMLTPDIPPLTLIELIEKQRFGVEYQPIIDINNLDTIAYEALARFYANNGDKLAPDKVYAALHHSELSLFQVEYQQKQLQLANAPAELTTFVNLDQDSYFSSGIRGLDNPFLRLFNEHHRQSIVVELIENSEINDAVMSLSMIDCLTGQNISTAIDDVCNPQSMISTSVIQQVNFIKLDKHVVAQRQNTAFMLMVDCLVSYARRAGKKVVLEGIELLDDLLFARELGVDYVQGYLFKERFKTIS